MAMRIRGVNYPEFGIPGIYEEIKKTGELTSVK